MRMTYVNPLIVAVISAAAATCFAQQPSDTGGHTNRFVAGVAGHASLTILYSNSMSHIRSAVGQAWFGLVTGAQKTEKVLFIPLQPFDLMPPDRAAVTARLGKPDREMELQYPKDVSLPSGAYLTTAQLKMHCMWYKSMGVCFLAKDKSDESIFAIVYDPKRDKP